MEEKKIKKNTVTYVCFKFPKPLFSSAVLDHTYLFFKGKSTFLSNVSKSLNFACTRLS